MTERIILGVLCLTGWSISSCLARQYHYVADRMNWTEAQEYCRETYVDLATIDSHEEMKQFNKTVLWSGINSGVWIGVYGRTNWKWSDNYTGAGAGYRNWHPGYPDHGSDSETCVFFHEAGWYNMPCFYSNAFVCYGGTQEDPKLVYVESAMNWTSAQRFCRENFIDLANVRNHTENQEIQSLVPGGSFAWIGLYRNADVSWSDGSDTLFRNWDSGENQLDSQSEACGLAVLQRSGRWQLQDCAAEFPSKCYSKSEPVKRRVMKLRIQPDDPSVDLNDPAVKAGILNKLQERLKSDGLDVVSLKWKEQPGGKVFHKEGTRTRQKRRERSDL